MSNSEPYSEQIDESCSSSWSSMFSYRCFLANCSSRTQRKYTQVWVGISHSIWSASRLSFLWVLRMWTFPGVH